MEAKISEANESHKAQGIWKNAKEVHTHANTSESDMSRKRTTKKRSHTHKRCSNENIGTLCHIFLRNNCSYVQSGEVQKEANLIDLVRRCPMGI